jgi:uncharacterized protein involved in exopolysaccharide biosynthesis
MNNSDFQNNEDISSEEQIKNIIGKLRFYSSRLISKKRNFIVFNLTAALFVLAYLIFAIKPYYISAITILPEYGSKASMGGNLSSLASLAGINIGGEGPSTEIYANLIRSESILEPVIYEKYKTEKYPDSLNLIDYFEIEGNEAETAEIQEREKFLAMVKEMSEKRITTSVDRITKILELTITMPESKLSADVANKIVESLDNYIRTQRKSFATEQSYYLEQRIRQVKDTLRIAEDRYRDFADRNRGFLTSPTLMVEQGRLQREVEIQQAVYIEITKQYELVQIEKIKDTPVLNIREKAKDPVQKAGPKRAVIFIGFMFFSVMLSAAYYMFKDEIIPYIKLLKD